ncbi:uncharacterized protein LOC110818770 isoform X4 [Carica papaya]|uniref:uncharacterized protein LOC110818770 isoform X4 n=1 Tax=Carica papaya TaxID=3649 RepID=UPI000B8D0E20|nr:uncharacterized protein LOC110818770 isoform X4 [Carica papaya]
MLSLAFIVLLVSVVLQSSFVNNWASLSIKETMEYVSAIGDPGMRSYSVRVAMEAWNFCNEVGAEAPDMVSPRWADCADLYCAFISDATEGFNGGYHYNGRGIMRKLPESPKFTVKLTLDVKRGGGANSQFYLIDIGSCWKNNGDPCDGDVLTDVTRYSEMIINPETTSWCRPNNLASCPPYHISPTGEMIYRNETTRFPYSAYHLYCSPGNAEYLEKPYDICDPYSNPQAQELVQILPHPEWSVHGYPEKQGDGWIGDPRTWELDVGALSSRLYFYQNPGTKPARRIWSSINVGTEIYVSKTGETAEWTVSDFDVLVPKDASCNGENSY